MTLDWSEGTTPGPAEYVALRAATGLGRRSVEGARIGLRRGLHAVTARNAGELVAMGRVVGDGGCFAELVDIAVAPAFQGQGVGTEMVRRLLTWADDHLPATCFLSLIADPSAERLYARAGFQRLVGMGRTIGV